MFKSMGREGVVRSLVVILVAMLIGLSGVQLAGLGRVMAPTGSGPRPAAPSGHGIVGPGGPVSDVAAPSGRILKGTLVGHSYKNDVSPPLRDIKPIPPSPLRL